MESLKLAAALSADAFKIAFGSYASALSAIGLPHLAAVAAIALSPLFGFEPAYAIVLYLAVNFVTGAAAVLIGQAAAQSVPFPKAPFVILLRPRFWGYLAASFVPVFLSLLAMGLAFTLVVLPQSGFVDMTRTDLTTEEAALQLLLPCVAALASGSWVYARLFLVMPAMAAGEPFELKPSVEATKGRTAAVLFAAAMVSVPLLGVQVVLGLLSPEGAGEQMAAAAMVVAASIAQYVVHGALGGAARVRLLAPRT